MQASMLWGVASANPPRGRETCTVTPIHDERTSVQNTKIDLLQHNAFVIVGNKKCLLKQRDRFVEINLLPQQNQFCYKERLLLKNDDC